MIIVDDRLSLAALAGRLEEAGAETVATTWTFHYRLLRALADDHRAGSLTTASTTALRALASAPPPARLIVLDPRDLTETTAAMALRHGLNLLAAELVAAAKVHSARVKLSAANVGRRWPEILASEGIDLQTVG